MNASATAADEGARAIAGPEAMAAVRLQLLMAARHKLAIYLPTLPAAVFSSAPELAELRRIAITGRGAQIRIVLGDAASALRNGHRLLDLAQRLPTAVRIRTPHDEDRNTGLETSAWLLNDASGYLFLPDADRPEARAALRDGPGHAPLLLRFEHIWERALPASGLQPLGL